MKDKVVEQGTVRIIVIGGSAGSLFPLKEVISRLPASLGAAVFVVQHVSTNLPSALPTVLSNHSALPVQYAMDGDPIIPGRIYVAPKDQHMILERGRMRLQSSPKDPWNRPGINILFRSAVAAYGSSLAGVVMSGLLRDGTAGLWDIKNSGGVTIVQEPKEAQYPDMPESALKSVDVDYCLPAAEIGSCLVNLVGPPSPNRWRAEVLAPRILIVEDEPAQAIDLERQVHALGYNVVASVATGEEALRAAGELPDLALVDVSLGGKLDGIETATLLKERYKVNVIFTTAHDDPETIRRLARTLPLGYLGKPIRSKDLHGAIEVALSARYGVDSPLFAS